MSAYKGNITPQPEWTTAEIVLLKDRMRQRSIARYHLIEEATKMIKENRPQFGDGLLNELIDFVVNSELTEVFLQDLADHYATARAWEKDRRKTK